MTTKAELRRLILSHLTVIDPTDAPPAEMASLCDLFIDGLTAELKEGGLCWWDPEAIPAAVSLPLSRLVASQCCGSFGRANKGYEAEGPSARARIAVLKSTERREIVRGEYS